MPNIQKNKRIILDHSRIDYLRADASAGGAAESFVVAFSAIIVKILELL